MASKGKSLRRKLWALPALAALSLLLLTSTAPAADRYWVYTGTPGWWNNAAYWSATPGGPGGAGQPRTGDKAWLTQSDNVNRWVYFYTNYPSDNYNTIQVYSSGSGSMTFYVGAGNYNQTLRANELIVGGTQSTGVGNFRQDGWTTAISSKLSLTNGSILLKGGSFSAPQESIGGQGPGTFTQTGGSNILDGTNNTLIIGEQANSSGAYNLSGTGYLRANKQSIGKSGSGQFIQTGGSNILDGTSNTLFLGELANSSGTYQLSGTGYLRAQFQTIGRGGTGAFTQTGGTNLLDGTSNTLVLGELANSSGTYQLSGTGQLSCLYQKIGRFGTGTFTQTGGSNILDGTSNTLFLGEQANSNGTYQLSGTGYLRAQFQTIGRFGTGTFTQTGGTNLLDGASNTLVLGEQVNGNGTYQLSGTGQLSCEFQIVGSQGHGLFTQSGGSNTLGNLLYLGLSSLGVGTYELGGTGSLSAPSQNIGFFGAGTFKQTGGTNTSTNEIRLADGAGSSGAYELSGGTVNSATLRVGDRGTGVFKHTGGLITLSGGNGLRLAEDAAATGTYELSDPTSSGSNLTAPNSFVGVSGAATFKQSDGYHNVIGGLLLGLNSTSHATYDLSGGYLSTGFSHLGVRGAATFTQTNGTHYVSGDMVLAFDIGSSATYNLKGGNLTVGGNIQVNSDGVFNHEGGSLSVGPPGEYFLNYGAYTHKGGSFDSHLLNYGEVSFQGLFIASRGMTNYGNATINQGREARLHLLGLNNSGALTLAGGTLGGDGPLVNNALLTGYGTITGTGGFTNNALLTVSGGNLTLYNTGSGAGNNNYNYGNFDLAPGRVLLLQGNQMFINQGTLNLNRGVVNSGSTAMLLNQSNGTLTGPGTIAGFFQNNGTLVVQAGTTNIINGFQNYGLVELTGPTANLTGGAISYNPGSILGCGTVGNNITNSGVIEARGGILRLAGTVVNNSGGQLGLLTAGSGATLLIEGPFSSNTGIINLTGGTLYMDQSLTNNGQISGFGTIHTQWGGLTNDGSVRFAGGFTTVHGPVTNNSGKTINVYYPALFTGPVTNNGTFKVTGISSTLANAYVFAGGFTGSFTSDPATSIFSDLTLGPEHYLVGGLGDHFIIQNNLVNRSANLAQWDTRDAALSFTQGDDQLHDLYLNAADLEAKKTGFLNNFAWGSLTLEKGQFLNLLDGNDIPGGAMYVGEVLGLAIDWQGRLITNISGHGLNIYYDPLDPENAYLKGQTFAFLDGGHLAPAVIPLPGSVWLLLTGVVGVLGLRARRRF